MLIIIPPPILCWVSWSLNLAALLSQSPLSPCFILGSAYGRHWQGLKSWGNRAASYFFLSSSVSGRISSRGPNSLKSAAAKLTQLLLPPSQCPCCPWCWKLSEDVNFGVALPSLAWHLSTFFMV